MTEIHGTCDPRFELVVDLWGGHTTEQRDAEWGRGHPRQRVVDHHDHGGDGALAG